MDEQNQFKKAFTQFLECNGIVQGIYCGDSYVLEVENAIAKGIREIENVGDKYNNLGVDFLKGYLAEQWHGSTLLIDAARKGMEGIQVEVPRDSSKTDIWYGSNSHDHSSQVKYWGSAEDTAKAISHPDYSGMEKIVPSDQLEDVKNNSNHLAIKNVFNRPEQAEQYAHTALTASDHISIGSAESIPLSQVDAKQMSIEFKRGSFDPEKYGLNTNVVIEWSDILRESCESAIQAALFAAALNIAPVVWNLTRDMIKNGDIDFERLAEHGIDIINVSAGVSLKAAVSASLTAACHSGLLGSGIINISPAIIGMATVITFNAIKYGIQLYRMEIDTSTFANYCIRDCIIVGSGALGGLIAQVFIPVPMLGALIGNILGITIGSIIYHGANNIVLKLCAENEWILFNLVKQEYILPTDVLQKAGYKVLNPMTFPVQTFKLETFPIKTFDIGNLQIIPVKRGVIGINRVGYIKM